MSYNQNFNDYGSNQVMANAQKSILGASEYMGNKIQQASRYVGNQFNQGNSYMLNNEPLNENIDKSFGEEIVEKIINNEKFIEKEAEINNKLGGILDSVAGGRKLSERAEGLGYLVSKVLIILLLFSFLMDRYDIIGLFFAFGVLYYEPRISNRKYLYRWMIILALSVVLDVFCILDIIRYIGDSSYKIGSAGSAMSTFGIIWTLIVLVFKAIDGYCVWKMAINFKNQQKNVNINNYGMDNFDNIKNVATGVDSNSPEFNLPQTQH